jgi:aspartate-semialdehyde dehydrogenase
VSIEGLLEVAVVGATGALGSEVVGLLTERSFPVGRLVPIGTERSLGDSVSFGDEEFAVVADVDSLEGFDLVFLCAPPEVSLRFAGHALRARVPAIDLSGALIEQPDVDLRVAEWLEVDEQLDKPLVAGPGGIELALALVLRPLERAAGLRRVVATCFESVSAEGRGGVDALSEQTVALFNQHTLAADSIAFDCRPASGIPAGAAAPLLGALGRLLGGPPPLVLTRVRVPTFSGDGISLWLETERALCASDAHALLAKASGVEPRFDLTPTTRNAVGSDVVLAGRVEEAEGGLRVWLALDGLRLAALNGVLLAEARPFRRGGG